MLWVASNINRPSIFDGHQHGTGIRTVMRAGRTNHFPSLGSVAARCKECPFVSLQKLNPGRDVARIPDVTVEAKFRTQECSPQLRNQFLRRVVACAEPVLQISIKARLVSRLMREFMEGHVVEMIRALERIERRHRNKIAARHIKRFTLAFANISSGGAQESVGKLVARVGITNAHWLPRKNAIG